MGRVYLIRHGEVAWNKENAYVGSTDLPLNDTGREQAKKLADAMATKGLAAIYSSDLSRARETAETIGAKVGLAVNTVHELQEVSYGDWEGLPETEIARRWPDLFVAWRQDALSVRIPGGESFAEMRDRAFDAFCRIARAHPDQAIAITAHKSVNRVLLCCLLEVNPSNYRRIGQGNACVNVVEMRKDGTFVVEAINERCHLPEDHEISTAT